MKKKIINDNDNEDDIDSQIDAMKEKVKELKGVWLPDKNGKSLDSFNEIEKECILQQINILIEKKYNFIHYNPFPSFKGSNIKEFQGGEDDEEEDELLTQDDQQQLKTNNQKIVRNFEKSLKHNIKKYNINSPFYNQVIIIDEVHNFVREIVNNSGPSRLLYEWIINAQNIKLVFLSGTPVINKPCEIAILFNMLKGLIHIYTFTIRSELSAEEVTEKLNKIYYDKPSPIELFHIEKHKGKIIASFIQESSGFESVYDDDQKYIYTIQNNDASFETFISIVYKGLHSLFKKDTILPTQESFQSLTKKEMKSIQRGKIKKFDEEFDIVFNRKQKLFTINVNDKYIDMTDNDRFMEYFFESSFTIPKKKRILLKRMLMGLTSYCPIDRSSIVNMPQVIEPVFIDPYYQDYTIVKTMNIVTCPMSQMQFEKYVEVWAMEKSWDEFRRRSGRNIFDENDPYHYQIRTRQTCNCIYENDDFRLMKKTEANKKNAEDMKEKVYQELLDNKTLTVQKDLEILSPKLFQMMKNISKFIKDDKPTGKILFYSDFRSDAGCEAFELVLQSNGYEKFDHKNPQTEKGKRYTFITGSQGTGEEKRMNKEYFNNIQNKYGEYCQVMIITQSGAEGISLECVRQVHIFEPYWNYVRINQVLGRAIRMQSHTGPDTDNPWLPKDKQNVEQYLYLSVLPIGNKMEDVYLNISNQTTWNIPQWKKESITKELLKDSNREIKELIDSIIKVNVDSDNMSADQHLFEVMEKKYKLSEDINNIVKEASLDCIPHTRDDPEINNRCLRFSDKLSNEIAYFPGLGIQSLENIDVTQLKSTFIYFIQPNIYVISAKEKMTHKNIFIYYEYTNDKENQEPDIRYLRDNGKRLCDIYVDEKMILNYVDAKHPVNDKLGQEFSVYQEIYSLNDDIIQKYIREKKFPPLKKIIISNYLDGFKIKYNINDTYYYLNNESIQPQKYILKIYPYLNYEENNYSFQSMKPLIIHKGKVYINE